MFTELTTLIYWITNQHFSPFRWAYSLTLSHSLRVLLGTLSLVYMLILACKLVIFQSAFSTPISTSQSHSSAHSICILIIRMYLLSLRMRSICVVFNFHSSIIILLFFKSLCILLFIASFLTRLIRRLLFPLF